MFSSNQLTIDCKNFKTSFMNTKTRLLSKHLLLLLCVSLSTPLFSQNVITVTNCNLSGWVDQRNPNSTISVTGAVPMPPLGEGSVEFNSPTGSLANFRSTSHHNTFLSSLTEFRYSTFIVNRGNSTDNAYVVLQIDRTGDGLEDDRLLFEPRFQTGSYVTGIVPDQGPTLVNTWQTWDMLNAIWWLGPPPRPNPEMGGVYFSLASYISQYPDAKIVNQFIGGGTGGIRLNVGAPPVFIPAYWGGNFTGYLDAFTIGVNGNTTIYNFEASIANAGADKTVFYGYGSNCTTLAGTGAGGVAPYNYEWSGHGVTSNSQSIEVCPTTTTTYTLTTTDARGCLGTDQVTVFVSDVRCGSKNDKVLICHKGEQICVSPSAVKSHLNHGDNLGSCGNSSTTITRAHLSRDDRLIADQPGSSNQFSITNHPNPFVNSTNISYQLPFDCNVSIIIYDAMGSVVAIIVSGNKKAGLHNINVSSKNLRKGIYYYKITASSGRDIITKTNKLTVLQ
jgi:hypothetical protein